MPQESLVPFEPYINKEETILAAYFPKRDMLKPILFSVGFYIISMILFYLISYIIPFPLFLIEIFILFLAGVLIFIIILSLLHPPGKFLFTTEKIIVKYRKSLYFTSYGNILTSTCNLHADIQEIDISLKGPLKGENSYPENKSLSLDPPRALRIWELLIKLRNI